MPAPDRSRTRVGVAAATVALAVALALAPLADTRVPRTPLAWLGALGVLLAAGAAWRWPALVPSAVVVLAAQYAVSLYHRAGPRGGEGGAPPGGWPWPRAIALARSVGDTTPTSRSSSSTSARLCLAIASLAASSTAESSGRAVTTLPIGRASSLTRTSGRRSGGSRRIVSRLTSQDRLPSNSRTGKARWRW